MILDLSTINFVGGGGESSAPAGKVETVEVNITMNGVENPTLNEGFSAFGDVTVNSDNVENSSALLFNQIGYSEELNTELNAQYNADIAYSKEVLDKWNNGEISSFDGDTKLVYCPMVDTSNKISMINMFFNCISLQFIPLLETSNVTTMSNMFYNCSSLKTIPLLETDNVTNMESMFYYCTSLKSVPLFITSMVNNMDLMFYGCTSLKSLPLFDVSNVTKIGTYFGYSNIITLTDLGGFKDLKINWNDSYGLAKCPNLTYQSVMNVLNNLYDFRANGDDTTTKTLKLHSNSYNLLSADDIALANGKGWVIQS